MKTKKIVVLIAVMLVAILATGAFGYLTNGFKAMNPNNWLNKQSVAIDSNGNPYYSDRVYEMPSNITFLSGTHTAASNSINLTATITPSTAANKKVDWFVSWGDPTSTFATGKTVTDYLTVVPTTDGSLTAVVTCLLSFEDEIILIRVVTRDGGFESICNVTFGGVPTAINVDWGDMSYELIGADRRYNLTTSTTYDLDLSLTNSYDAVGTVYNDYSVSVVGISAIWAGTYVGSIGGSWWSVDPVIVTIESIKNNLVQASIVNGKLRLETGPRRIGDGFYTTSAVAGNNVAYYNYFDRYVEGQVSPYLEIVVTENVSGIERVFNVKLTTGVSAVSMPYDEIVF